MFGAVVALWRRRRLEGWTQKRVADAIGRDPAWVSKNLRAPGNWTMQTAGELIQALEGEADVRVDALEEPLDSPSNFDAYEGYALIHQGYPAKGHAGNLSTGSRILGQYVINPIPITSEFGSVGVCL